MSQSSPRPSVDDSSHGAAPFLHNLTQRLRKGSSVSSQDSAPPTSMTVDPMSKTEASRAARRMILQLVRDDWDWPTVPARSPSGTDTPSVPHRDPISFRLREEAQSDLEAEDHPHKRRSKSDPYKFESPDAVADVIAERKRKRRKMVQEELTWNEGLQTWQARRDAWTGALQHMPVINRPTERRPSSTTKRPSYRSRLSQVFVRDKALEATTRPRSHTHSHSQSISTDGGSSFPASPTSPTPECSSIDSMEPASPGMTTRTTTNTTVEAKSPLTPSSTVVPVSSSSSADVGPWLPIYPPILPRDDIIRDRIKPSMYPTIYSKIVVQGLSPNVPIPLCHMIPALVDGWKNEGNWPPQPSAPLAADIKKGRKSSTFAKWRKEHTDKQSGRELVAAAQPVDDDTRRRGSIRKSIGMMRKMGSFLGGAMSSTDGLDELGIEFSEKDQAEMDRNVALNQGAEGVETKDFAYASLPTTEQDEEEALFPLARTGHPVQASSSDDDEEKDTDEAREDVPIRDEEPTPAEVVDDHPVKTKDAPAEAKNGDPANSEEEDSVGSEDYHTPDEGDPFPILSHEAAPAGRELRSPRPGADTDPEESDQENLLLFTFT
ncbi:hypothetical protein H2200_002654 [Cladophialophora chaetospira]|uniref:Gag1-like clamp domain-containing protein n=1 Tax=Cladophialophora chaetospira TaxID=386627 RepID=A0AA38XJA9_9EURO|nr:hypothetical protein H2200_002654 [Cladophialophora chaetospira]